MPCTCAHFVQAFGKPSTTTDARNRLYRAALSMNLIQTNYGHQMSVIGHQGGRLFPERAIFYLLGKGAAKDENFYTRINQLKGTPHASLISDLHALSKYGNRVDHDELPDLRPNEKVDIVHGVYRVARRSRNLTSLPYFSKWRKIWI